ncbi:MAG: hypothetical protein ACUVV3_02750 [Dehalococcoidia bacterium]
MPKPPTAAHPRGQLGRRTAIVHGSSDPPRGRIARPGEAPIDGQLVCYYPCPRCSNPARALVYLGDSALASEVVAQAGDEPRHPSIRSGHRLGLLAAGAGLVLNGGHGHWGGRPPQADHLSLWTEPPAASRALEKRRQAVMPRPFDRSAWRRECLPL